MKFRNLIPTLLVALPLATQAWFMPYPKPAGKYPIANASDSASAHSTLQSRYSSWKSSYAGSGRIPNNVSEGSGYAMLMAVLANDRAGFMDAWSAAENILWLTQDGSPDNGWYAWKPNAASEGDGQAATDADEDIALALIYATALVKAGYWPATSVTFSYNAYDKTVGKKGPVSAQQTISVETRAKQCVHNVEKYMTSSADVAVSPKNHITHASLLYQLTQVGGAEVTLYNPSYFAPGWYRIFQDFDDVMGLTPNANWDKVISNGYIMIKGQPGASKGMARDWSDETGKSVNMPFFSSGSLFGHVNDMTYDAIRTPYRIGLDAYWFGGADATTYVNNAAGTSPAMYQNLSSPQVFGGANEPMAVGMWGAAYAGGAKVGNSTAKSSLSSAWGKWISPSGGDGDYFKGALNILGGFVMSGNFPNVWADLKATFPDTSTKVTTALKMTPDTVRITTKGDTSRIKATATFSKAVSWYLYAKGRTSSTTKYFNAKTASTKLDTSFFMTAGTANEVFDVKVYWPNCKSADTTRATFKLTAGGTGVITKWVRQDLAIRMGANSLNIQMPDASGEAVRVRILDLAGRELRSFSAQPNQGQLEVSMADVGRGTQMLEIVDRDLVHRGLIPVVR